MAALTLFNRKLSNETLALIGKEGQMMNRKSDEYKKALAGVKEVMKPIPFKKEFKDCMAERFIMGKCLEAKIATENANMQMWMLSEMFSGNKPNIPKLENDRRDRIRAMFPRENNAKLLIADSRIASTEITTKNGTESTLRDTKMVTSNADKYCAQIVPANKLAADSPMTKSELELAALCILYHSAIVNKDQMNIDIVMTSILHLLLVEGHMIRIRTIVDRITAITDAVEYDKNGSIDGMRRLQTVGVGKTALSGMGRMISEGCIFNNRNISVFTSLVLIFETYETLASLGLGKSDEVYLAICAKIIKNVDSASIKKYRNFIRALIFADYVGAIKMVAGFPYYPTVYIAKSLCVPDDVVNRISKNTKSNTRVVRGKKFNYKNATFA